MIWLPLDYPRSWHEANAGTAATWMSDGASKVSTRQEEALVSVSASPAVPEVGKLVPWRCGRLFLTPQFSGSLWSAARMMENTGDCADVFKVIFSIFVSHSWARHVRYAGFSHYLVHYYDIKADCVVFRRCTKRKVYLPDNSYIILYPSLHSSRLV